MGEHEGLREKEPFPEKGRNVYICLKFIRHGERTKEGELTDYGRKITREKATASGIKEEEFDAFKAIGSPAGPKGPRGMPRSLETADIYVEEIGGDKKFITRGKKILSFESIVSKPPYNHTEIYNANLPKNFEQLSDEEKVIAARKAQAVTVDYLFSLKTPEAISYRKEIAGAFAYLVNKYKEMAGRLESGSRVLMPAGTHGPLPECFLQEALIRKTDDGQEIRGFKDIGEIGGPLDPSESFSLDIQTDENGEFKRLNLTFDNPERPTAPEMYLNPDNLNELQKYYKKLHKKNESA